MTNSKDIFMEQREFELMQSIPVTKSAITQLSYEAVEFILESGNPLEYAQMLSAMEQFITAVKKDDRFIDAVVTESQKNAGKVSLPTGTKIEVAETGVKYDYSGDHVWAELEAKIKPLREKQKEREDYLKKIPVGKQLIDENGELIATGPSKTSTTSYKVTLSK